MAVISRQRLSGSANGQLISVNAASSPGVTIHTAVSGTLDNQYDEIYLWATNNHTAALTLTVEWGNAAACLIRTVPTKDGAASVCLGLIAQNAEVIRAYAQDASKLLIGGFVNRILQ